MRRFGQRLESLCLSPRAAVLTIVIISVAVKLAYITLLGGGLASFPAEGSDVYFYDQAARGLLKTGVYMRAGYPTTVSPPGQAVFVALLYGVSDYSIPFVKLAHIALLTLAAVLTYLTGAWLIGPRLGWGAAILVALDPAYAYLANTFLSEPLFIVLMMASIYFLTRDRDAPRAEWLVGAGLCLGLAGLTRNEGWSFALALVAGAVVTRGQIVTLRAAMVALALVAATIAPWTYRNYQVSGHLVLVSSNGGLNLWSGNNPEFVWRQPMPMSSPIYAAPSGRSEVEFDWYYRQRALEWMAAHPAQFVANGFRKVIVLYSFDPMSTRPEVSALYRLAGLIPYGLMLPFIAIGLLTQLGNRSLWLILWYILFTTALAVVFFGDSRVRAPLQPYLYLLGMLGVQAVAQWWRARWRKTAFQG